MSQTERLERDLTAWFSETASPRTPYYTDDLLARTSGMRQRPAWTLPERWLSMSAITLTRRTLAPVPWRAIGLLALLALLTIVAAAIYIGSTMQSRPGTVWGRREWPRRGRGPGRYRPRRPGLRSANRRRWRPHGRRSPGLLARRDTAGVLAPDRSRSRPVDRRGGRDESAPACGGPDRRCVGSPVGARRPLDPPDRLRRYRRRHHHRPDRWHGRCPDARCRHTGRGIRPGALRMGGRSSSVATTSTGFGLYAVRPDGTGLRPVTASNGINEWDALFFGWSPDGNQVAYQWRDCGGDMLLYVCRQKAGRDDRSRPPNPWASIGRPMARRSPTSTASGAASARERGRGRRFRAPFQGADGGLRWDRLGAGRLHDPLPSRLRGHGGDAGAVGSQQRHGAARPLGPGHIRLAAPGAVTRSRSETVSNLDAVSDALCRRGGRRLLRDRRPEVSRVSGAQGTSAR